jgi:hypothetical protein
MTLDETFARRAAVNHPSGWNTLMRDKSDTAREPSPLNTPSTAARRSAGVAVCAHFANAQIPHWLSISFSRMGKDKQTKFHLILVVEDEINREGYDPSD